MFRFLDQRKQAKMQSLQDPNQTMYVGNSKINLRLVGKKKRVVIAPKRMLGSNK